MKTIAQPQTYDDYAQDWKIFIDTCSLLNPDIEVFWQDMTPCLKRHKNVVFITTRVYEELQRHQKNIKDPGLAQRAKLALRKIAVLQNDKLVEIRGEKTDNFADNVFQFVITKFRMQHKILLITQDNKLARTIDAFNKDQSCNAYPVYVRRLEKGKLDQFSWMIKKDSSQSGNFRTSEKTKEAFRLCKTVTSIPETPLDISQIPDINDNVYTNNGPIRLTEQLAGGGEGIVYKTNTSYVAKIFKPGKCTKRKLEKIKLFLSRNLSCTGICFPVAMLQNSRNEFVGYLMPEARGEEIGKCIFHPLCIQKIFPHWKKKDTVKLCLTILEKIKYLHVRNIIMGDINQANIKVVSPTEVYFVDTDSYQVEDLPCPVGTESYTAKEIQGKHFPGFLRTFGNEYFSVATLLFMIMLLGKPPYSVKGGASPKTNICNMEFPYPFDGNTSDKVPEGNWIYIWSHLPYKIKEGFYQTFQKGGKYSSESTRLNTHQWIKLFENYHNLLVNGTLGNQDRMSEELIPTRFKELSGERTCDKCGQKYYVSKKDLRSANDTSELMRVCPQCRNNSGQNNNYHRPTTTTNNYPNSSNPNFNNTSSNQTTPDNDSEKCYITTAVCQYLGKPDNCKELTALRWFRDNWLQYQPDGKRLIEQYYQIAPQIVDSLNSLPPEQCKSIYLQIWDQYILPCLNHIQNKNYTACKRLYIAMTRMLQSIVM